MECSKKEIAAMADVMVQEMQQQVGLEDGDIRTIETEMREMLRAVGAQALGQYLEKQDEAKQEEAVVCPCGQEMEYQFKRGAKILSVFGWRSYRRRYHICGDCHVGQAPSDKRRRHGRRVGEQNDLQAQEISYHCDFKTGDEFSDLFWTSACQGKADLYEERVFVCDGAVWIWKLIERHFPHAVQIAVRCAKTQ